MKKLFVTAVSLMGLGAMSAFGAAVSCATPGDSISFALSSVDSNSYTCGDKIFSGFTNPNGVSGTVTLTELNTDQYKLSFTAAGGGITSSFSFGYTVAVAPGFPTWNISQIQAGMLTGVAAGGGSSIPNASTGTLSLSSGAFSPTVLSAGSAPDQNSLANVFTHTETVGFAYDPNGAPLNGAAGKFTSIDYIINQTQVPEPMTLSLMGFGLLGIGVFGRKRMKG